MFQIEARHLAGYREMHQEHFDLVRAHIAWAPPVRML